nr:MAG TPA: hypothetical protein [Caudoviricetes sp.]
MEAENFLLLQIYKKYNILYIIFAKNCIIFSY